MLRKYGYSYDDLNRLREAIYQRPNDGVVVTNSYNENMDYDKNGNITRLNRNGDLDDLSDFIEIDKLHYTYDQDNPNRLMKVYDESGDSSGFKDDSGVPNANDDYSYDSNGNMVRDGNKDITEIKYNHLNLPTEISFVGGAKKIGYLYDAAGQKLRKTVSIGSQVFEDDYLDGFQYINTKLSFFPTAEGYVRNTIVEGQNNFRQ